MRYFISSLLVVTHLCAFDIDTTYKSILEFLRSSINSLDIFLSDSNVSIKQRFDISTWVDTALETKRDTEFKFNIRAHLELPRTRKRLHLFLQDFKTKNSIDYQNGRNLKDSINNNSYLFGLQYLTKTGFHYKLGIKFNTFDPFAGAAWEYTHHFTSSWLYYGFNAKYYAKRHLDTLAFMNYQTKLSDRDILSFENSYRYEEDLHHLHQYLHALKIYHSATKDEIIVPHFEIYCDSDDTRSYKLNYYYAGVDYENTFYRKWLFYKLSPAVLWRMENDFDPSYRVMVSVGIRFEQH